jgi:hypothetical protein
MSQMLHGKCIFSQSGAFDFQNILGSIACLFIAALFVEDPPHEELLI